MRVLTRAFVAVALCLGPAALMGFQGRQTPPVRDNAAPPVGTAVIAGAVVSDDASHQPLRRVSVMLASGALLSPQGTITDELGRFVFTGVVGGNYTIAANRPGYVPSFYGSRHPGKGPGVPIAVLDGQRITNIVVPMLHGSAITGAIRSQSGQPAAGLEVQVLPVQTTDGQRSIASSAGAIASLTGGPLTTDDRGVFRAFGLAPGDYIVRTQSRDFGGLLSSESRQVSSAEVQWAQTAIAQGAAGQSTPTGAPAAAVPAGGHTVSYSPVYFPGTTMVADAATVTLGPNEERRGVDFTTQLVPTARLSGLVLDPDGRPLPNVQVSLKSAVSDTSDILGMMLGEGSARTQPDGAFNLSGIRPGRYALTARGAPPRTDRQAPLSPMEIALNRAGGDLGPLSGLFGTGNNLPWWASDDLAVDGSDITGLTLRMQPGMNVSGRIVYQGTALPPPPDLTKMRVSLATMPTSASPIEMAASMMTGAVLATTAADGTFMAKGVTPGKYRASMGGGLGALISMMAPGFAAQNGAPVWMLKSIMWRGRDVADMPLEVKPNEDITDVVVTMIDQPTVLSGAIYDQAGRTTPNFPIVVFSTDRAYWTNGSRRIQQARPASDGKYKVTGLPAGDYYVCAVTDLEPEDLYNPVFLDRLRVAGPLKITLGDGEKKVQDLKLAGG